MANEVKPFGSIELAVKALLVDGYEPATEDNVGGSLDYQVGQGLYIRVDKVPGGRSDRFGGDFVVDLEVFGVNYLETESHALDIEALLLGYPHVVEVDGRTVVFDEVSQNSGPDELPWEDDEVSRLGATYVITARRR